MRILVVGAGAMGSTVGGFLARDGHSVTLLDCEALMGAVRAKGLRITGIWGEHRVESLRAVTDLAGMKAGDFDLVLVSVKSYDTTRAVESFEHLLDENTLVCSYQNGLGNAEKIAEVIQEKQKIIESAIDGHNEVKDWNVYQTIIRELKKGKK